MTEDDDLGLPPLAEIVEANPELKKLAHEVHLIEQWQFQSPYLPPAILEQYERIVPGFSKQYLESMQQQTTHRQALESKVIDTQTTTQRRAQPYTFALGALALLVALVLGMNDHEAAAVAVVGLDFFGLGGVFVYGRISNVREARRKEQAVPDPSVPPPVSALAPGQTPPKGRATQPNPNRSKKKRRR